MKTASVLIFALLGASGVSASQTRAVNTEIVDLDVEEGEPNRKLCEAWPDKYKDKCASCLRSKPVTVSSRLALNCGTKDMLWCLDKAFPNATAGSSSACVSYDEYYEYYESNFHK